MFGTKQPLYGMVIWVACSICCFASPMLRADWDLEIAQRLLLANLKAMSQQHMLAHLQNRSTVAIEGVDVGLAEAENRRAFNTILPLAAQAAQHVLATYGKAGGCARHAVDKVYNGPEGGYAQVSSLSLTSGTATALPHGFPKPAGWGQADRDAWPVVFVSFRGTDMTSAMDWLTNISQGMGQQSPQYKWAINVGATVLHNYPRDHLVIFTGHSLGGSLASFAALAFQVGAITFNSAGLHPYNFEGAVEFDAVKDWNKSHVPVEVRTDFSTLAPDDIGNLYHFISHTGQGKTDIVANVSFAGYSLLAGTKFFIPVEFPGEQAPGVISLQEYVALHSMQTLCDKLTAYAGRANPPQLSARQLYGRPIYVHPKPQP